MSRTKRETLSLKEIELALEEEAAIQEELNAEDEEEEREWKAKWMEELSW